MNYKPSEKNIWATKTLSTEYKTEILDDIIKTCKNSDVKE
jgi:hypothetical protein